MVSAAVFLRGAVSASAPTARMAVREMFGRAVRAARLRRRLTRARCRYAAWHDSPVQCWHSDSPVAGNERSVTLLSNCQMVQPLLAQTARKARELLAAGAYVHQFAAHGADKEALEGAVVAVEQLSASYATL